MYSLTVKPSFLILSKSSPSPSVPSSSSSSYCCPRLCSSIGFPVKTKIVGRRLALRIQAYDASNSATPSDKGDSKPPNGTLVFFLFTHFPPFFFLFFFKWFYFAIFLLYFLMCFCWGFEINSRRAGEISLWSM